MKIDHEYRVTGPPGTGKTTYLSRQAKKAAQKHRGERIMVTSLTRSAASEVAGRSLPIPNSNVGTLHSICYRALGHPELVVDHLDEWNEEVQPIYSLSGENVSTADVSRPSSDESGDVLRQKADLNRSRMIPHDDWNEAVYQFYKDFQEWKNNNGYFDFIGLIERCIHSVPEPPGEIDVLFADEVQDYSKLETTLLRQWGEHTDRFVIVGDPDQSIYEWRGANPHVFSEPELPPEQHRTLDTSYRVPSNVIDYSLEWIRQIGDRRRNVVYEPHEENGDGEVQYSSVTYKDSEQLVSEARDITNRGGSVMFLGSCAYMLSGLVSSLREHGLSFHNPYRRKNGQWNPLHGQGTQCSDRIEAFCRHNDDVSGEQWTDRDMAAWVDTIKASEYIQRGQKKTVTDIDEDEEIAPISAGHYMNEIFEKPYIYEEAKQASERGDVDHYESMMLESWRTKRSMQYALTVAREQGLLALCEDPNIIIGTIHSVKGGQADHVYVFPDISRTAWEDGWQYSGEERDPIIRQFYVAMTRAKKSVTLCEPTSKFSVGWL